MQKKNVVKREMALKKRRHRQIVRFKIHDTVKNCKDDVVENFTNNTNNDNNSIIELERTKSSKKNNKTREIENNELNEENNER